MEDNKEPWRDVEPALAVAMERADDALTEADLDEAFVDGWGEAIFQHKESVALAITAIRRGNTVEAITELEREFFPKWQDRASCEAAYREAMGR